MKYLLSPLLSALFLFQLSAEAGEFADRLPADTLLYVESKNLPEQIERYTDSAMWESIREFDWIKASLFFLSIADFDEDAEDVELSEEELRAALENVETAFGTLTDHLSEDWALSIGQFGTVLDVFREHEDLRAEFFLDDLVDGELDEEDPELLAQLEREAELDATEFAAILSTVSILADVRDEEVLEETLVGYMEQLQPHLAEMEGLLRLSSFERNSATIHALSYAVSDNAPAVGLFWTITDGVWALAFTEEQILQLTETLKEPAPKPLASLPDFQQSARAYQNMDSFTYVDLSSLDRLLRKGVSEAEALPTAGSFTAEKLVDWLDLAALLPFSQGTRLEDHGFRTRSRFGFKRETPLSRMFYDEESGPYPTPSFLHRDVPQFSLGNWHMGRFWNRMEQELMQLAPEAAAGLGMARMLATGQLGFDLKLQFFDHLDSGILYIQEIEPEVMAEMQAASASGDPAQILEVSAEHPTSGQNYLIGLELKNEEQIRSSIDRLMMRFFPDGPPEPEGIGEFEILNPLPPGLAGGMFDDFLHIAFLDGWLVLAFGERSLLDTAIEAAQDPALQMWQDPEFQKGITLVPQNAGGLQYTSGSMQEDAMRMMESSFQMMAGDADIDLPDFTPLSGYVDAMVQTTLRKGLVVETESFITFRSTE